MNKRTKRYGGFLIGDRVQRKDGVFKDLYPGIITAMRLGRLTVQWVDLNHKIFKSCFQPKDLINLTRQEECKLNKEQLDKFTRKHFNQSADEYLKEDMEMTKKIIEDFCNPQKDLPIFDWRGTDFGEIQKDWSSKGLLKEEHLIPKSEMNERLREQAEQELSEMYGVDKIFDNPALEESKENITHISEETANELNDAIRNNKPIVAQIDENGKLCVAFKEELEERLKRLKDEERFSNGTWNFMHPHPYNQNFSSTADF